ncbi:hypothetical protein K2173_017150 [Erythroxylum novogranatense]|uniref:F-box domain-containing protein n=1 Tax=Erythroxylum novogranatense TaxID=1862640 RepID=A0AAV8U9D8_9ROSI|nr:hypothetical protein K2173_017150 [Erythroxylum novogranatense]
MSTFSRRGFPKDLLASIANCLNFVDSLRFRGVCKSWRSSINRYKTPTFPRKLPFSISSDDPVFPNWVMHIGYSPKTVSKDLNLLDYRAIEIATAYIIRFNNRSRFPPPRMGVLVHVREDKGDKLIKLNIAITVGSHVIEVIVDGFEAK